MKLPENILDCSVLEIARDIPEELTFFKNHCRNLTYYNHIYKNILIGVSIGIGACIIYKTINHYAKKKSNKRKRLDTEENGTKHPNY